MSNIVLLPLEESDREQFITDNQEAFLYGATQEFGIRDEHYEEDGQIISRRTIERSIDHKNAETYRIIQDGKKVGGVIIKINKEKKRGDLEILFVSPKFHSKGIGYATWCSIEKMHPEIEVWETFTPYFEKRNIHFYVNRCGFHIVEFFNSNHQDPHAKEKCGSDDDDKGEEEDEEEKGNDEMFRFEKVMYS
uniref:Acetyltransferase n=1 Tax=Piromyces sp. TaxID=45796 RepID=A0A2S1TZJ8_PIRSP|nr:Acetyltransferase [Piromyces sp.]